MSQLHSASENFKKRLGKSLKAHRKESGYKTARSFAEAMGMNVDTYRDYEQGKYCFSLELAEKIAKEFNCTIDDLVNPAETSDEAFALVDLDNLEITMLGNLRELSAEGRIEAFNLISEMLNQETASKGAR